jgi:acyl-CoA synthetase (AMP-forming)/AMP-acid ligase II
VSDFDLVHRCTGVADGQRLSTPATIPSILVDRARDQGTDPYLTLISPERVTTVSYLELEAQSRQVAWSLRRELQVRAGDIVGLVPANDVPSVLTIYALLRAGCSVLLLNPADPPARIRSQADALSVRLILRSSRWSDEVIGDAIPIDDAWMATDERGSEPELSLDPAAAALYFGTSGSTAASKIVAQSHYNAAVNARGVCRRHRLQRGTRVMGCLPFHHVNGVHFTLFAALAAGAHAVVVEEFDPFTYLDAIRQFRPQIASVVPTILEALLDAHERQTLPDDFRGFVSAAAPLDRRTARGVYATFGVRVHQGYGLTETTNFSTMIPPEMAEETYRRFVCDADIPSVGAALYGNDVAVLRQDGSRAAAGETGELCMRGHNVMMHYVGNQEATAEAFRGGWFHSQDLGFEAATDSGAGLFVITGRTKNIAKVGGEAVSLEEMERVLRGLPYVKDAACVSRPHRLLGDEIVAVLVSPDVVNAEEVKTHLRRTFAAAAMPRQIIRRDSIPRTPTGKIRRAELAHLLSGTAG